MQEKSEDVWYKEGLHFECTGCGKCCTGNPGYVWVTEEEIEKIATLLNLPIQLFKTRYIRRVDNRYALIEKRTFPHDCVFLKDNQCTIYSVRPKQCRTFPWWPYNLSSPEAWKRAAKECEGINDQALLVPFEKIEEQLKRHLE